MLSDARSLGSERLGLKHPYQIVLGEAPFFGSQGQV